MLKRYGADEKRSDCLREILLSDLSGLDRSRDYRLG